MIFALILAWAIIASLLLAIGWSYSKLMKDDVMPQNSDAPCMCGHARADHDDSGFGGCRRCPCGQYEPDYSVNIPPKNEERGIELD